MLQENEYSIKHLMFKELRAHLITIQSQQARAAAQASPGKAGAIAIRNIPPSLTVRALQA